MEAKLGLSVIYTDHEGREYAGTIGEVVGGFLEHYVNIAYFDFRVPSSPNVPKGKLRFAIKVEADEKLGDGEYEGGKHTWRPA